MRTLEELTQTLAKNLRDLESADTKKRANRAELMLKSTTAKIDMLLTHDIPVMEEQTVGDFYEEHFEDDPTLNDPDAQWFFEQEDVAEYLAEKLEGSNVGKYWETKRGNVLMGEIETDIVPSELGECYVQIPTRAGTVFGAGESWSDAMIRALAAYEEIKKRAKIDIRPIPQKEANEFIATVHRHHDPPQGDKFRLGAFSDVNGEDTLVGVVIVGRPPSRKLWEKYPGMLEVTRMATLAGASGLNSQLYSAAWRETQQRDYDKLITILSRGSPVLQGGEEARLRLWVAW